MFHTFLLGLFRKYGTGAAAKSSSIHAQVGGISLSGIAWMDPDRGN
jgi:hypothetical protein